MKFQANPDDKIEIEPEILAEAMTKVLTSWMGKKMAHSGIFPEAKWTSELQTKLTDNIKNIIQMAGTLGITEVKIKVIKPIGIGMETRLSMDDIKKFS